MRNWLHYKNDPKKLPCPFCHVKTSGYEPGIWPLLDTKSASIWSWVSHTPELWKIPVCGIFVIAVQTDQDDIVVPVSFVEKSFSTEFLWVLFKTWIDDIHVDLLLDSVLFHQSMSILMPYYTDLITVVLVSPEIRQWVLQLCSSFSKYFGYPVSFAFPYNIEFIDNFWRELPY